MICVVNKWEQDFATLSNERVYGSRLGDAMLTPTSCVITEEAGGEYRLQMTHPIDNEGKWQLITPFSMILAPIPKTEIPAIDSSGAPIEVGNEVWSVDDDSTNGYADWTYAYPQWKNGQGYYPGNRVNHNGYVWECVQITLIEPTTSASAWKRISPIRPIIKYLQADTELIVSSKDTTYLHCTLLDGSTCWVRISDATYMYTIDEESEIEPLEERTLTHQLFRVLDVTHDGKNMQIQVSAIHTSYDYSMNIVGQVTLHDTPLTTAIMAIRSAVLPDGSSSAPNIYAEASDAVITSACTRRTLTSIILDPEEGIVRQARARLVRDNHDFFLLGASENRYVIRYGVNLIGVNWRRDYSKLVTRVMPIAKDASGNDYYLSEVYVDSPLRSEYPLDAYQALQVDAKIGETGTEAEVILKMQQEAAKVFSEKKADLPITKLTVDFLMLGDSEEFAQYKDLEHLNLYDEVEIVHPDLGLTTVAQVTSYEWDAILRRYNKITLGDAFSPTDQTVYGYNLANGTISAKKLTPEAIDEIRNG